MQFTGVSSSAHPVYAGALSAPSLIVEAIATGATGAFTVNLLEYPIGLLLPLLPCPYTPADTTTDLH